MEGHIKQRKRAVPASTMAGASGDTMTSGRGMGGGGKIPTPKTTQGTGGRSNTDPLLKRYRSVNGGKAGSLPQRFRHQG